MIKHYTLYFVHIESNDILLELNYTNLDILPQNNQRFIYKNKERNFDFRIKDTILIYTEEENKNLYMELIYLVDDMEESHV